MSTATWQQILAQSTITLKQLTARLDLPSSWAQTHGLVDPRFPLRAPEPFIARMQKSDPADPLLLQVLPQRFELAQQPGYSFDPLLEQRYSPVPGLIHKYHKRALLTLTGACAIHCRYCFRQHFPYHDNQALTEHWDDIIQYLTTHTHINEVILSGGDPLILKDQLLQKVIDKLTCLPHITRLRIHTRLPIVIPQRITLSLTKCLSEAPIPVILVIHSNHSNELNSSVAHALEQLKHPNITLLNQSVLLKGVNDHVDTLVTLSERLFAMGVLPYYLHTLDKVAGAAHFDLSLQHAKSLHAKMAGQLPGFLLPRLVSDIPNKSAKTLQ